MANEKIIVEISCYEVWRRISDYVDNDIEPELKARMASHFVHCKHCKAILDGTRNVVALIGDELAFDFEFSQETSERMLSDLSQRIAEYRPGDE